MTMPIGFPMSKVRILVHMRIEQVPHPNWEFLFFPTIVLSRQQLLVTTPLVLVHDFHFLDNMCHMK